MERDHDVPRRRGLAEQDDPDVDHHKADLTIALCDAWVLTPDMWQEGTRLAVWAPIDHYPIPPKVLAVLAHDQIQPVAMTRNGELMREAELDPVYVPHGVDTKLFRPRPDLREKARAALGLPQDAFLVGMVAANRSHPAVPRKSFPQAFMAFSRFAKEHKDAWMYVHSQAKQDLSAAASTSTNSRTSSAAHPAGSGSRDTSWDLGMDVEYMAVIYQAFDVLLNPRWGRGSGSRSSRRRRAASPSSLRTIPR